MKIRARLDTKASAQQIWDYVSEPNNDPEWADTSPIDVLGNGPNMEVTFRQIVLGKEVWGTAKVREWNEPHKLVWDVEDTARLLEVTYEVKDGWFRQTSRVKLKRTRWMIPLLLPVIWQQLHKQCRTLKTRLDDRFGPSE